jgi:hypothetical protein
MTTRRALEFARLALASGLRPTWGLATAILAIAGGTVLTVVGSDPTWLLVAALAILLVGGFAVWDEAERRAAMAESKAARTDLLEKQNAELAKQYAVSQAQYKVLEDFRREHGGQSAS